MSQNDTEALCFSYSIFDKDIKGCFIGWIEAFTLDEARIKLLQRYPDLTQNDIKELYQSGTWAFFESQGNQFGWD